LAIRVERLAIGRRLRLPLHACHFHGDEEVEIYGEVPTGRRCVLRRGEMQHCCQHRPDSFVDVWRACRAGMERGNGGPFQPALLRIPIDCAGFRV
ncbi:hypothetical protein H0H92_005614, partial [Tricholoma furcatifolium]